MRSFCFSVFLLALITSIASRSAAQSASQASPPDAPQPQAKTAPATPPPPLGPCELRNAGAAVASAAAIRALDAAGVPQPAAPAIKPAPCPPYLPVIDWYSRFLNGPQVKRLTAKQKAWLAVRNVGDPYNILTIVGNSALFVAFNSHSAYGPGMPGFARNVGVSFSQDVTGEFFGTFLIPSIVHQDPHYHRMPHASIPRRFLHAVDQIAWTQGDDGRNMINYADLIGSAIDIEVGNLYVPGEQTDLPASAQRYAIGLGLAPEDNLITEFLPDVARRIHIHIVFVQRIINQVAGTEASPNP